LRSSAGRHRIGPFGILGLIALTGALLGACGGDTPAGDDDARDALFETSDDPEAADALGDLTSDPADLGHDDDDRDLGDDPSGDDAHDDAELDGPRDLGGGGDAGDASVDSTDGDTPDLSEELDLFEVLDEELPAEPLVVRNLVAVENTHNVLSYFVEWRTEEPVPTHLEVVCGAEYHETFGSETPRTSHSVLVLGLIAGTDCDFTARARLGRRTGEATTRVEAIGPLPDYLPELTVTDIDPERVQPGWTLLNLADALVIGPVVIVMVDEQGRYRWIYRLGEAERHAEDHDARVVPEGVLIGGRRSQPATLVSWEGEVIWTSPFNTHHDIRPLPSDPTRYLYLGEDDIGCPAGAPEGTLNELDRATGETVFTWRACEHLVPEPYYPNWTHMNGIAPFPDDRYVVVSVRNQHQLVAIDRTTGETLWVLGVGGDFELERRDIFLRQHAPEVQPDGNILLFDNGLRGSREYSRALELRLVFDEEGRPERAERAWHYTDPSLFARVRSDANRLANGNTLITYDQVGDELRSLFLEVTVEKDTAWRMITPPEWSTYRSERVVEPVMGIVRGD
jgi:hypothetical protein